MELVIEHLKHINWLAVLVAGLANFTVGALWYQPFSFGNKWAEAHGIDKTKVQEVSMGKVMAIGFITTIITAIGAALFISPAMGWKYGMIYGFLMGVFVIGANLCKHNNFLMKPTAATMIDAGHDIVVFTLMGAILGCWA
jgi:hypothetical protein